MCDLQHDCLIYKNGNDDIDVHELGMETKCGVWALAVAMAGSMSVMGWSRCHGHCGGQCGCCHCWLYDSSKQVIQPLRRYTFVMN